jgi:tetratricopeptide (TPR) repeat protein
MKAGLLRWGPLFLASVVVCFTGVSNARGQYGAAPPVQAPPPQQEQKPADTKAQPKVNKAEEDAYKAFYESRGTNPGAVIQSGELFVAKFPTSRYVGYVYGQLSSAYFSSGQEDKMFSSGAKALELNPDNTDVLALMAMAMPRRVNSKTADAPQQLQKAEGYARHAIELIPNLPKPEGITDEEFEKAKNEQLSMAHSGLGIVDFNRQKYGDARTELTQAVQLAGTPDPVDEYVLGIADVQTSHFADAVTAFGKCSDSGPLSQQCKARGEDAKKKAATELSAPI